MQTMNSIKKSSETKDKFSSREFPMTNEDFENIRILAKKKTGIELGEHKKEMIYSRVVRRIRALRLSDFKEYLKFLEENEAQELTHFINTITTNLTSFFRESHHFDYLSKTVMPEIVIKNKLKKSIRIWSAGCSTGEEPYSIAITLNDALGKGNWDAKILATDLDTNVISHGRNGVYAKDRVGNLDVAIVKNNFNAVPSGKPGIDTFHVKENIKKYITFNQLNLLGEWPMRGRFDVIFCRNVVIYFSKETQKILFDRYADMLSPNGYLFIGHSESLHGVSKRFESVGRTIYRKLN